MQAPDGLSYNENTEYFELREGNVVRNVGGMCDKPSFWTGKVDVHFAPAVTRNPMLLKAAMVHEYTHVWHYYSRAWENFGVRYYKSATEQSAIKAEINYLESFPRTKYIQSIIDDCNWYYSTQKHWSNDFSSPFHF